MIQNDSKFFLFLSLFLNTQFQSYIYTTLIWLKVSFDSTVVPPNSQFTMVLRDVISQNELASFLDTLICIMKGLQAIFSILETFANEICNLKLQVDYTFL